jgi:hypothetical protein
VPRHQEATNCLYSECVTMEILFAIGLAFLIYILLSIVVAFPVMLLWDWLMPVIFGLHEITLLQAWGLSVLCGFLFKTYVPNQCKK